MIATSNAQYLHPDLPPAASQTDVKKSPLAMLVQTCSAIGKDVTVKPIAPALGRITSSVDVESFKQHKASKSEARHHVAGGGGGRSAHKAATPPTMIPVELAKSRRESSSSSSAAAAAAGAGKERRPSGERKHNPHSPIQQQQLLQQQQRLPSSSPRQEETLAGGSQTWSAAAAAAVADGPLIAAQRSFAAYQALYPHLFPPHLGQLYQAELAAHLRHQAEKAAAAGLYLKAAAAACRDPLCASCQLARLHSAAAAAAAAAFGPSAADKAPPCSAAALQQQSPSLTGGGALLPAALSPALLASLYPFPAPLAASGLPHVCHWIDGTDYCGKRFASTDDLLQHIRSHATESPIATTPPPPTLFAPAAAAYQSLQAAAGGHQHQHHHHESSSLPHRSHGFLGAAAARHHPYGIGSKLFHFGAASLASSASSPSTAAAAPPPSLSSGFLSSMYPSIYGAALGAAAAP